LSDIQHPSDDRILVKFTYSAGLESQEDMALAAEAVLHITFGKSSQMILHRRAPTPRHIISVLSERFYNNLVLLGYGFETNILKEFRDSNVLDDYYTEFFGFLQSGLWLSRAIAQLTDRYPHFKALETGESAKSHIYHARIAADNNAQVLGQVVLQREYSSIFLSYTFTGVERLF